MTTRSVHKLYIYGFPGEHGEAIIDALETLDFSISGWVGDRAKCSENLWSFLLGNIPTTKPDKKSVDGYKLFFDQHFNTFAIMSTRRGIFWKDIYELRNEFALNYYYWYNKIKNCPIDIIIFANFPHEGSDYVLYNLARQMGIKTLLFYQSQFTDRFFASTTMEDFGVFNTIRTTKLGKIPIKKGFKENVAYMDEINRTLRLLKKNIFLGYLQLLYKKGILLFQMARNVIMQNSKKPFLKNLLMKTINIYLMKQYRKKLLKSYIEEVKLKKILEGSQKIIYFPLHYQPELTTSGFGGSFEDQLLAIETLSTSLNFEWVILVKENPMQTFYQRGDDFFTRLANLNNVYLVEISFPSITLIEKAHLVSTITGTAGWEAIKGGKKCVVFGNAWYSNLPGCYRYSENIIKEIIEHKITKDIPFEEFENAFDILMDKSCVGTVDVTYDVRFDHFSYSENALKVSSSIKDLIQNRAIW